MKTFLGVLETDVFKMDMELGDIGPRGEERETGFVGEQLDWPGQRSRIFPLGFKEGTVVRQATDAVGVDTMAEEEDDEDEDIFNKARGNTVLSTTSHPQVRATAPCTRSSLIDSTHTTLSMVNASHPETDTSVMTYRSTTTELLPLPPHPACSHDNSIPIPPMLPPKFYIPSKYQRRASAAKMMYHITTAPQTRDSDSTHRLVPDC
jgi:hypothetical protein